MTKDNMEINVSEKTAVVFGGTGLVGGFLLKKLCGSRHYKKVVSFSRRRVEIDCEKLEKREIPFKDIASELRNMAGHDIFITLGTTIRKAGSKKRFEEVDKSMVLKIAEVANTQGFNQLMLVTAMGANPKSYFFYNKVKGELESEILKFNFWSTHIFRPSLLLGERNENRFGEKIAVIIGRGLDAISGNLLKKYKPIEAEVVAEAMVSSAQKMRAGKFIYPSNQLQDLADEYYKNELRNR